MIEVLLSINGSILFAWLFALTYRIKALENQILHVHDDLKKQNREPFNINIDQIVDSIQDSILETIGNMRPPTAIDHIAGVWSQIMMMREQAKLVKEGILPNSFNDAPETEHFEEI